MICLASACIGQLLYLVAIIMNDGSDYFQFLYMIGMSWISAYDIIINVWILCLFCYKLHQVIYLCINNSDFSGSELKLNNATIRQLNVLSKQLILTLFQIGILQSTFAYSIWSDSISVDNARLKQIVDLFAYTHRDLVIVLNGFLVYVGFAVNTNIYVRLCKLCHSSCNNCYTKFIINRIENENGNIQELKMCLLLNEQNNTIVS